MMLTETQGRLEGHFRTLSLERVSHRYPVYAFEHGLRADEIASIRIALCKELVRARHLGSEHWLLWIVVAAEIGYTYDGDEYWMSFATEMPEWVSFGDRDTVRNWFKTFAANFSGFSPSGRWADHFSIIAWPITHSVLPRYLQSLFARHLYELRHDLAETSERGIDQLGELLNQRYDGHSSRFESFLQQTALTARLVLALRDEDVQDVVAPIYRPTLARIISDLERKGSSRGYLRDARRVLREARMRARTGLTGLTGHGTTTTLAGNVRNVPAGVKLIARQSSDETWGIGVAIPDVPAILKQSGITAAMLDKQRMRFADKPDGWMPGRALLAYSRREHVLSALPPSLDDSIIQFEGNAKETAAVSEETKILTRPPWLLRIHEDGIARQVLGNHARMRQEYLVATTVPVTVDVISALNLQPMQCRTRGILLYEMTAPSSANHDFLQALAKLEIGYALKADVEPIGLVPRWDESVGSSVWLPSEEIILRLSAEFDVSEFSISVDSDPRTHFTLADDQELFVSLGTLPLGRHVVEVGTTARNTLENATLLGPIAPETIFIEVRPPIPWRQGILTQAGFRALVDPGGASVEDVTNNRATISVHGPAERVAVVEARLFDSSGHLSESTEIGRVPLPASQGALAACIAKLAREPLSEKLHSASRVDLAFSVDELGTSVVTFTHKVDPLRWKLDSAGQRRMVRLIDEAGVARGALVDRFDLQTPDKRTELQAEECVRGVVLDPPGALFVARYDSRRYATVTSIPATERLSTFSGLGLNIALVTPEDSPRRIMRLLVILRYWQGAQALGPLAPIRRGKVIEAIEQRIRRIACGTAWADRADRYRAGAGGTIEDLQRGVGGSPGFASRMRTTVWSWYPSNNQARAEFCRLAKFYNVTHDSELGDLAVRLAFNPASIRLTDPEKGADLFEQLCANATLAKGAFFAKLAADAGSRSSDDRKAGAQP